MATYGAAPDIVPDFAGATNPMIGAMRRVVDVRTHVDMRGSTDCDVTPLHPPMSARGYDVTYNNPRY